MNDRGTSSRRCAQISPDLITVRTGLNTSECAHGIFRDLRQPVRWFACPGPCAAKSEAEMAPLEFRAREQAEESSLYGAQRRRSLEDERQVHHYWVCEHCQREQRRVDG